MSNYKKLNKKEIDEPENINESNTVFDVSIENNFTFLSNIKNILLFIGERAILFSGIGIPYEEDDD
jgi:hypothetical protein